MLFAFLLSFSMQSCLKDKATKTYKVYAPVTESLSSIKSKIKNSSPQSISQIGKISVLNNYIFLVSPNKGIHIIDNSNTSAPVNKSFIVLPGCYDIAITGNILYADCYSDLVAIDISNPTSVKIVKSILNQFPDKRSAYGYFVDSTQAIVDWAIKDTVVKQSVENPNDYIYGRGGGIYYLNDISASVNSSSSGKNVGTNGSMARFAILNNYLYTVSTSTLSCIKIANPQDPIVASQLAIGWNIETIYPFKDKLFIGSQTGMNIYDVKNPSVPVYLTGFSHARVCDPVIADSNYAYVTLHTDATDNNNNNTTFISLRCTGGTTNELDVLDISNLSQVKQIQQYILTRPNGLGKEGNTLIVCDGSDGLKIFDASDPSNLILKQKIALANTYDVICMDGVALVSTANAFYQYDYSDINNVKLLSKLSF